MGLRTERLIALRQGRGWSRRELSRRCGFGPTMIAKYEDGTSDPSATHLMIIADQFGVSTDYLLGRSDDPGGQFVPVINDLSGDERTLVARFRDDGWYGVARLVVARLAGRSEE